VFGVPASAGCIPGTKSQLKLELQTPSLPKISFNQHPVNGCSELKTLPVRCKGARIIASRRRHGYDLCAFRFSELLLISGVRRQAAALHTRRDFVSPDF
jgi:hypothetical protein